MLHQHRFENFIYWCRNQIHLSFQILLRWGVQKNCALLPKSAKAERCKSNLDVWDFKIEIEDMDILDNLNTGEEDQNTMAGWLREHDPDFY